MSRSWKGLVLLALVVGAVCVRLGFWQLDRLGERRARNAVVLAARSAEPVVLGPGRLGAELDQRRVRMRGEFDRTAEVVIRGATWDGGPGVRVMTPLRLEGTDTLVLTGSGLTLDLTTRADNRFAGIEKINLTGSGNNTLELSALDLLNLSNTTNQLTVNGNAGDAVDLVGAWVNEGAGTYTLGEASILIGNGIDVNIFVT